MITQQTQKYLIGVVRSTINHKLKHGELLQTSQLPEYGDPVIHEKRGVFVTLKLNNRLRGCVGCVVANRTLLEQTIHQANNAAFNDQRFSPVEHMKDILCEISVLSPARAVKSFNQIDISKHGIILEKNNRRALFLPKVAKENNWSLEHTLMRLCDKAGLETNQWRTGASFEVFEAFEFKE
jgi:AmmeMemoRadiSam system protein A